MTDEALEVRGICKGFPGVQALQDVSLRLANGSIHALLGENGAGKSTLIKIVTGVYRPDAGRLMIDGKTVSLSSPRDAIGRRIAVVFGSPGNVHQASAARKRVEERRGCSLKRGRDKG